MLLGVRGIDESWAKDDKAADEHTPVWSEHHLTAIEGILGVLAVSAVAGHHRYCIRNDRFRSFFLTGVWLFRIIEKAVIACLARVNGTIWSTAWTVFNYYVYLIGHFSSEIVQ